jgi:hypothetical protein
VSTGEVVVRPHSADSPAPASVSSRMASALPTWGLITTKNLELRRRRGLMIATFLLVLGPPVLVYGFRLLFHAVNPSKYGSAGSPSVFQALVNLMTELGFVIAVTLGAAAGTTDLTDGMFRNLVITGRSRVALFLARIPAGLAILLPIVALAFTMCCLVTTYAGTPNPASVNLNTVTIPVSLSESQFHSWLDEHPRQTLEVFPPGSGTVVNGVPVANGDLDSRYAAYTSAELTLNPPLNEMVKIGLWLGLVVVVGFIAGLGLGSLTGQRTVSTIVLIGLEIIVTPILAAHAIPYFLGGQRLDVGLALDQLRPAGLTSGSAGGPGGGRLLFGGRGALQIPPMPIWGMVLVIVGWLVGWSVIGAWRMATRDA